MLVFGHIITARFMAAIPAFQIVSGIDVPALWTSIVFSDFFEPLLIPNSFYLFKIGPKLNPVRHCRLEFFQVIAWILFTFTTEVNAPLRGTS